MLVLLFGASVFISEQLSLVFEFFGLLDADLEGFPQVGKHSEQVLVLLRGIRFFCLACLHLALHLVVPFAQFDCDFGLLAEFAFVHFQLFAQVGDKLLVRGVLFAQPRLLCVKELLVASLSFL